MMKTICMNSLNKLMNEAEDVEMFFNTSRPGVFITLKTDKDLKDYYIGEDDGEKVVEVL